MLLFRKKLFPLLPLYDSAASITTLSPSCRANLPRCLLLSYTSSSNQDPPPTPHFMVEYLTNTLGLSPEKAAKASKKLTHLKSPEKPDSVLSFLRDQGFSDERIAKSVLRQPHLLVASLEKTLQPNMMALLDVGLSQRVLTELLLSAPEVLRTRRAASKVRFWKDFLGGDEMKVLKVFKSSWWFVNNDIDSNIVPKIALLQELGFSDNQIKRMLSELITSSVHVIKKSVKRTEELGIPRDSPMFLYGLKAVTRASTEKVGKRMELVKSFGWSEDSFFLAFRKAPSMVLLSEKNIREKLVFLVEKVGCEPSYVASRAVLLTYSLRKRLIPRHNVLRVLKSKGISCGSLDLFNVMCPSDLVFIKKYILPHHEEVPELYEAYIASGGSQRIKNPDLKYGKLNVLDQSVKEF